MSGVGTLTKLAPPTGNFASAAALLLISYIFTFDLRSNVKITVSLCSGYTTLIYLRFNSLFQYDSYEAMLLSGRETIR